MSQEEFLKKHWASYQKRCVQLGIETGTKEGFITRNTPKDYKPDYLTEKTPKAECLKIKTPLFKAEENITIPRRVLKRMLEDAAKRGYQLAIKERITHDSLPQDIEDI